ncbi:MAG: ABC-ATPase domain-containing protein [Rubrobacteraceae bacterium]
MWRDAGTVRAAFAGRVDEEEILKGLESILGLIDGGSYGAYGDLKGSHHLEGFILFVDRVQRDPFAPPSLIRVRTEGNDFDPKLFEGAVRRVAFEDFLTRRMDAAIREVVRGNRGSGKSGRVEIQSPSQVVLPRTSIVVKQGYVEARMAVGLPARGRTVDARAARAMLLEELPQVVGSALTLDGVNPEEARRHVETVEDAGHLRELLPGLGLVAFVADGSVLPRESGASDRPLSEGAVPFESPEELRVSVELPNRGRVSGMRIREGITLVVGGGFHGKSTLLSALSWGVYDHVPGDGREYVVTRSDAVEIRAEDGRSVAGVDISGYIGELPGGTSTKSFSTPNASGSTSQAANIAEALEVDTSLLLVDEDTSATNFMIRDARMRALIRKEPISPFVELVRWLHRSMGVSTIVVVGGVGDYLDVADHVILLEDYRATDVTGRAATVREELPTHFSPVERETYQPAERHFEATSMDLRRGKRESARSRGLRAIELGRERVDLSYLEQLAEEGQTEAIARMIARFVVGQEERSMEEVCREALATIRDGGLDSLGRFSGHPGELSLPRAQEIAGAINRIRPLKATAGTGQQEQGSAKSSS